LQKSVVLKTQLTTFHIIMDLIVDTSTCLQPMAD